MNKLKILNKVVALTALIVFFSGIYEFSRRPLLLFSYVIVLTIVWSVFAMILLMPKLEKDEEFLKMFRKMSYLQFLIYVYLLPWMIILNELK